MNMTDWAKREIEIACIRERGDKNADEWDYGCACYESAYKAFQSLVEDEHSRMNIRLTQNILNRLIEGKPLTLLKIRQMRGEGNQVTTEKLVTNVSREYL